MPTLDDLELSTTTLTPRKPPRVVSARFVRRQEPLPAAEEELERLPEDVKQLLLALYEVHYLESGDIALVHFPGKGVKHVLRWLRWLYDQGYVERIPRPVGLPMVYVLGRNGLRFIAQARGLRAADFKNRYRDRKIGTATLPHNLEVNHFWAMQKHATLYPTRPIAELGCFLTELPHRTRHRVVGARLVEWMPESELYLPSASGGKRPALVEDPLNKGQWLHWLPDAHFRIAVEVGYGTAVRAFVLERERSRRSLTRFLRKARALVEYNQSRDNPYDERFGAPSFYRVLVVTNTWKDAFTFGTLIAEANLSPGKFLFCRYDELTPKTFLEKRWLRASAMDGINPTTTEDELQALLATSTVAHQRMSLLEDKPLLSP